MEKILIFEDDIDTVSIFRTVLAEEGFATISSACLLSVDDIYSIDPDLIIMDNWLIDGRGSELCSNLKKSPLTMHIPVILCSVTFHLEQIASQCSADAFLEKPFDLDELIGMVHMLIYRSRQQPA